MLGFSKTFVIVIFIALIFGFKMGWQTGLGIIAVFAVIKLIWKFFT